MMCTIVSLTRWLSTDCLIASALTFSSRFKIGKTKVAATMSNHLSMTLQDANSKFSTSIPKIHYIPSYLEFHNVSHSNPPPPLVQQLFTFTRSRTWALQQISLSLNVAEGPPVVLLTGQSASGKSTLLNLIEQKEPPTLGTVVIASQSDSTSAQPVSKPILLDVDLSPYGGLRYESRKPLQMILQNDLQTLRNQYGPNNSSMLSIIAVLQQQVLDDLLVVTDLAACVDNTPAQLSPSVWHIFVVVRAVLASMLARPPLPTNDMCYHVPGPILCIDEAWDREAPVVLHAMYHRLQRLFTKTGGIGIIATHVPDRFPTGAKRWTLCRGALLPSPQE
jgi:energy-coupling factor transporter ATP-binding protein EcfA2